MSVCLCVYASLFVVVCMLKLRVPVCMSPCAYECIYVSMCLCVLDVTLCELLHDDCVISYADT